jgi:hypothetical protein
MALRRTVIQTRSVLVSEFSVRFFAVIQSKVTEIVGRAIAQAVSRRLSSVTNRFRDQVRSYGILMDKAFLRKGFSVCFGLP